MLNKIVSFLFVISLVIALSSCGSKLNIVDCVSNTSTSNLDCADRKGNASIVPWAQSTGYVGASETDYLGLLDYCAARSTQGTAAPQFSYCTSDFAKGGLDCVQQKCYINTAQNGAICQKTGTSFVPYALSENYNLVSPTDSVTLLNYCNITLQDELDLGNL